VGHPTKKVRPLEFAPAFATPLKHGAIALVIGLIHAAFETDLLTSLKEAFLSRPARIFLTGFLALLPLLLTFFIVGWFVSFLNGFIGPSSWFGRVLVSLGLSVNASSAAPYVIGGLVFLLSIYILGLLVESRAGAWFGSGLESIVQRIPLVSNIYELSKRFTSVVDTKGGGDLKTMQPVWCFFGGEPGAAVLALLPSPERVMLAGNPYFGILVPSAPVPVGGALIYVPAAWIKPAEGGVDHLTSVYVSMGVTPPKSIPA